MDEIRHIRDWYRYNSQVRKKYLRALARLPRRALLKDRGASFPSLLDIFVHTLDAYKWYFDYAYNDRSADFRWKRGVIKTMADARRYEREVDKLVMVFVERLDRRRLGGVFSYGAPWWKPRRPARLTMATRDMLLHMVEEELQHRGELNALLWQMGVEPPVQGFAQWNEARRE